MDYLESTKPILIKLTSTLFTSHMQRFPFPASVDARKGKGKAGKGMALISPNDLCGPFTTFPLLVFQNPIVSELGLRPDRIWVCGSERLQSGVAQLQ